MKHKVLILGTLGEFTTDMQMVLPERMQIRLIPFL